jgi:glyoxylase-like metal-dependent hydrolase (beta-lactamase superfamily II)
MNSLNKILNLAPETIYPAHGNIIKDAVEKIKFYIEHRNERERQIIEALRESNKPLSAMGIVEVVYATTPESLWKAAAVNVIHHLEKLKKEEKVREMRENDDLESLWELAVKSQNKL